MFRGAENCSKQKQTEPNQIDQNQAAKNKATTTTNLQCECECYKQNKKIIDPIGR